jgi:pimeloyl-ACP methyl ester carboxylesterase
MSARRPSTTVTTALGELEFAELGEGPPVLAIHGTPGGSDQGALMGRFLAAGGFRVIAPSRPGYLGTPLGDPVATPDGQADLYAALLDELEIETVAVLAWSGSGPSGYRFAARHGERVGALAASSAVSRRYEVEATTTDGFMFGTAPGNWLMRVLVAHAPEQVVQGELDAEGDLTKKQVEERAKAVMADPDKREFALGMALTTSTRGDRKAGYDNDLAQFAAIDDLELERVEAPTLIIQGTADTDVPPDYSAHAADRIPRARLLEIESGTHLALFLSDEAGAAQAQVLEHFAGRDGSRFCGRPAVARAGERRDGGRRHRDRRTSAAAPHRTRDRPAFQLRDPPDGRGGGRGQVQPAQPDPPDRGGGEPIRQGGGALAARVGADLGRRVGAHGERAGAARRWRPFGSLPDAAPGRESGGGRADQGARLLLVGLVGPAIRGFAEG